MKAPLVLLFLLLASVLSAADSPQEKVSIEDVIPLTAANMRGHRMLYDEGWYVITSSRKALEYAKEHSISASKDALLRAAKSQPQRAKELKENLASDLASSVDTAKSIAKTGAETSAAIRAATDDATSAELAYAREGFSRAWEKLIKGNLSIAKRTEADRNELASLPGNLVGGIKSDWSNIHQLAESANKKFGGSIENSWDAAFKRASSEFRAEYEKSGEKENSLMALGPILWGWLKSFYYGIAEPSAKSVVKTGVTGVTHGVFLPVADTAVVAGRTVQSVGLTFYYTGKTGVNIVSPTVEGGLLGGLSLLSLATVPPTFAVGQTAGAINQVAFTTAAPVYAAGEAAAKTAAHTAKYVAFVAYDGAHGATEVVINQASSGVVLGYNALTAIPAHLMMGVFDAAVFLAWDGPNLVIATAKGKLRTKDNAGDYSAGDIPVGAVVDLGKLQTESGMEVKIISNDPAVIRDVLGKIPCDLGGKSDACESK
ncbi:MAG: hypothetical protein HZA20_04190 [Nitrospirae bacterium]|nr:hypothetical protein [Nitrospirota bacterium]